MTPDTERTPGAATNRPLIPASAAAPLAIAAITALLRDLLANGIIRVAGAVQLGDVHVTVLPPMARRARQQMNQLNLFLYRVESGRSRSPRRRAAAAIRARDIGLKLHYLVTAYSSQDYHAELLLGCAINLLGTVPVLTADAARAVLHAKAQRGSRGPRSPVRDALGASDVLETSERIVLSQQFLSLKRWKL